MDNDTLKEQRREKSRLYYQKNRDKVLEKRIGYYKQNREKILERMRKQREASKSDPILPLGEGAKEE